MAVNEAVAGLDVGGLNPQAYTAVQLLRQEGSAVVDLILATKALLESQHGPSSSITLVRLTSPQCKNLDLQVVFRLLVRIAAAVAVVVKSW